MTWIPSNDVIAGRLHALERPARCLLEHVQASGGWQGELGRTLGPKLEEVVAYYGDLGAGDVATTLQQANIARSKPFTNRHHMAFMRQLWLEAGYRNELWRIIKVGGLRC